MTLTQITEKGIKNGENLNADINASAAIAGTKISPDFGSQNIATTGTVGSGNITVTSTSPTINFADTNTDPDFRIQRSGTGLAIQDTTNSNATRFQINSDGHVQIPADNQKLQVGASQDLELYHDSSNSIINNNTVGLYVDGNGVNGTYIRAKTGENSLVASPDGGVSLFFDNSKKFETTSGGVSVTGDLNIADDEFINVGTGSDFKIVHQSSDNATLLTEVGSGDLIIQGNDMILRDAGTLEKHIEMTQNGSVDIFYDGSKKFETSTNGAKIESGSANFEVYSSTDDEDAKITIIGKTASGGVGQAGRVEIVGESTNNSNGSSAMHLRTRKTNNTVTTALTINDEQKVSIGNTSPQQLLHVWPDAANTTSSYVRVTAGDRGSGTGLDLGHDSSGNCHVNAVSNAHLIFSTNSTERMRVLNGGGLTFNGDSSTDNALDDYEEGTFTPAFKATGASNNSDTTVQESRYVKIGGLVYVTMFIDMNAHGNSTGGSVNISGLPYTASGRHYPVTVGYFNNLLQNQSIFTGTVQPGTSLILLRHCTGACSATANMDYSNAIGTSTEMIVSAVYCSV